MSSYFPNINKKSFIINLLFSSLVLSFIAGNLFININILLIILISFFFYKKNIIDLNFDLTDKTIIVLFLYILLIGFFKNTYFLKEDIDKDFTILIKAILFLRYLILYFVIKFLIKESIINLKFFFITSLCTVTFVCLDIIYQAFFGYDIFGFKGLERRLSGPFGDELIAGSFIQRFSLFALFLFPIFYKFKKNYFLYFIIFTLVCLFTSSLILSGNRIPLVLFFLTISSVTIFEKALRKYFFLFIIVSSSIFTSLYHLDKNINYHFNHFQQQAKRIIFILSPENILTEEELKKTYSNERESNIFYTFEYKGNIYKMRNSYLKEFKAGYYTWKINKYFGGGIKSYIKNCSKAKVVTCNNHPHNYYLEILTELGLVGFLISVFLFLIVFIKTFIKKYFMDSNLRNYHTITPFIFLFFAEVFPIKTTGSFFTTGNATYIFLIFSIMISLTKLKN